MSRAWHQRVDALRRAGLSYIDRSRWGEATLAQPETSPPLSEPTPPPTDQVETIKEQMMPRRAEPNRIEPADKLIQLEALRAEVSVCRKCKMLCETRTQTVFNDGTPHAELCFVGEAPGADEDATGVPFVGKAGQLLTKIIEACQLQRNEVYICNVLKCRPPNNRNPMPDEIANCRPYLDRQLDLLKPKMMVALGKFAAAHLLGETPDKVPITKLRGTIHDYRGIPFMITLHPAYLLRNPPAKRDVWEDMKEVMRRLGRPVE